MGLLSGLLGDAGGGLIKGVADAADRFISTPDEKAAAELKAQALALKTLMAQIEVNEKEAERASVFVAGARPATLWLCAVCMGGIVAAGVYGWLTGRDVGDLFLLYGSTVAPVHLGLLGLRTYERATGKERNNLKRPPK